MDSDTHSLEAILRQLESALGADGFQSAAKAFEASLRGSPDLTPEAHGALWQRYQELWARHKSITIERSQATMQRYLEELSSLDFSYDGAPLGQTFANWERVGEKVRVSRAKVKSIREAVKGDRDLLHEHRRKVYEAIDSTWFKIGQSEDLAFDFHRREADRLFGYAKSAVEERKPGAATSVFKASRAGVKTLWLRDRDRDLYRSLFDNLWLQLQAKWDASTRRHEEWRGRQTLGLEKLRATYEKTADALRRVEENHEANLERLATARSESYADRVKEWLREGQEKQRDMQRFLTELEEKIRDAKERLGED